ncbi:High-affinity branched-chain amino acid transport system permease protein LivH [subsurface metagenome]
MDASLWLHVLVNGLMLGMTYALIASGLTLIFGVMRIFNFAHGEFYMLGAFAAYYLFGMLGLNFFVTVLIAMLGIGLLGILIERVFFRPFRGQLLSSFIISLGLLIVMSGAALLIFGGQEKTVSTAFPGLVSFLGVTLSVERLVVLAFALVLLVGLYLFITRTRMGRTMRAVAQDSEAAAMQGVNINLICSLGFGLACALAAAAGTLLAPMRYVGPSIGGAIVIQAAIVIVLGGLGSIPGAVIGALLLGLVQSVCAVFMGQMVDLIGFVLVILVLLFRPKGLLGHEAA